MAHDSKLPQLPMLKILDPRHSLAVRLGMAIAAVSILLSLITSLVVGNMAEKEQEFITGVLLSQSAQQSINMLDAEIYVRLQNLQGAASNINVQRGLEQMNTKRALLTQMHTANPEFVWIGLLDLTGTVQIATDGVLEGVNLSSQKWFVEGKKAAYVSNVYTFDTLAQQLPTPANDQPLRFLALAAPIVDVSGQTVGVLVAQLNFDWANSIIDRVLQMLTERHPTDFFILQPDGSVLLSSSAPIAIPNLIRYDRRGPSRGHFLSTWGDGVSYLTGFARNDGFDTFKGLGWNMLVRETTASAFEPFRTLRLRIAISGMGLGLLFAVLGVWLVHRLTRSLNHIADAADALRIRDEASDAPDVILNPFPILRGNDEVARVARSLNRLVQSLEDRNHTLREFNAKLEQRVAERTREVEQLSLRNQQSAVAFERVRMARELHDTLAHSLAAMSVQLEVMEDMAGDNAVLRQQIIRVGDLAHDGLVNARRAIQDLRVDLVEQYGLYGALQRYVNTIAQRINIPIRYEKIGGDVALSATQADTLFRIVQEALNNIEKHAQARSALLRISSAHPQQLSLMVQDDGLGFADSDIQAQHFGLRGLAERARLIGAEMQIDSAPNRGTTLTVTLVL